MTKEQRDRLLSGGGLLVECILRIDEPEEPAVDAMRGALKRAQAVTQEELIKALTLAYDERDEARAKLAEAERERDETRKSSERVAAWEARVVAERNEIKAKLEKTERERDEARTMMSEALAKLTEVEHDRDGAYEACTKLREQEDRAVKALFEAGIPMGDLGTMVRRLVAKRNEALKVRNLAEEARQVALNVTTELVKERDEARNDRDLAVEACQVARDAVRQVTNERDQARATLANIAREPCEACAKKEMTIRALSDWLTEATNELASLVKEES